MIIGFPHIFGSQTPHCPPCSGEHGWPKNLVLSIYKRYQSYYCNDFFLPHSVLWGGLFWGVNPYCLYFWFWIENCDKSYCNPTSYYGLHEWDTKVHHQYHPGCGGIHSSHPVVVHNYPWAIYGTKFPNLCLTKHQFCGPNLVEASSPYLYEKLSISRHKHSGILQISDSTHLIRRETLSDT